MQVIATYRRYLSLAQIGTLCGLSMWRNRSTPGKPRHTISRANGGNRTGAAPVSGQSANY